MRLYAALFAAACTLVPLAAEAQATYAFGPGCIAAGCLSASVTVGPPTQVPGFAPGTFGTPVVMNVGTFAFTPAPEFAGRLALQPRGIVGSIGGTATGPISRELPISCTECLFDSSPSFFALGFEPSRLGLLVAFSGPASGTDAPGQGSFALSLAPSTAVPEPSTFALTAAGLAVAAGWVTRRRRG